jgi:hypothetical protein
MMSQPVQQGGGQFCISEDLHPFAEGEIGGDEGRPPFVPLRYQIEEQFSAGAVERHESQFINDEQIRPLNPTMEPSQKTLIAGLKKCTHQICRPGKTYPETSARSLHSETNGDVRFPSTNGTGQDNVLSPAQVFAAGQFQQLGSGYSLKRLPIELVQGLDIREMRFPQPMGSGSLLA